MATIFLVFLVFGACLGGHEKSLIYDKIGGKEAKCKRLADAHNHLHGIMPVDVIKELLSSAHEHWEEDDGTFGSIPEKLFKNSNGFKLNGKVGNWIDSLDILCRIMVISILEIEGEKNQEQNKHYHSKVKEMLLIDSAHGSGMNGAGMLLSGCISLGCILDHYLANVEGEEAPFYYQHLKDNLEAMEGMDVEGGSSEQASTNNRRFSDIFKAACLINYSKGDPLDKDKWIFSKVRKYIREPQDTKVASLADSMDPFQSGHFRKDMEYLAKGSVSAALSCSLWTPFNDSFDLRGLLRGKGNLDTWTILSIKWLLENEVKDSNYLMEISIGLGELSKVLNSLSAEKLKEFGIFRPSLQDLGVPNADAIKYYPLLVKHGEFNGILSLRFLGSVRNSYLHAKTNKKKKKKRKDIEKYTNEDSICPHWAGYDFVGAENFEYPEESFGELMSLLYEQLSNLQKSERRNLWLRPHIGHGSWVIQNADKRKDSFDVNIDLFLQGLKGFGNEIKLLNDMQINEILEFVYRSFFSGWFPANTFKLDRIFSINSFEENSRGLRESKRIFKREEEICSKNLISMLKWLYKEDFKWHEGNGDEPRTRIRLGHVTYLFSKLKDSPIDYLEKIAKENGAAFAEEVEKKIKALWLDLNFGSDMIASAVQITHPKNALEESSNNEENRNKIKNSFEVIRKYPFISSSDQTDLVANSGILGRFIKDVNELGFRFVLGTDGQGIRSTRIEREITNCRNAASLNGEKEESSFDEIIKDHFDDYFRYCFGDLDVAFIDKIIAQANGEKMEVAEKENEEVKNWFRKKGIDPNDFTTISVNDAKELIIDRNVGMLKMLVNDKITMAGEDGILNLAVRYGDAEICTFILEENADINEKRGDGKIPIEIAIAENRKVIKTLMENFNSRSFIKAIGHFKEKEGSGCLISAQDFLKELRIKNEGDWDESFRTALKNARDTVQYDFFVYARKYGDLHDEIVTLVDNSGRNISDIIKAMEELYENLQRAKNKIGGLNIEGVDIFTIFGVDEYSSKGKKFRSEVLADAHNHIYGILPVRVIQAMLSNSYGNWGDFNTIPDPLVKDAEKIDFTGSVEWIHSLDVLCRIIVFSLLDMDNQPLKEPRGGVGNSGENPHKYSRPQYLGKVAEMVFADEKDEKSGRGMNGAGLLLSSCISLRILLDFHFRNLKRRTNYFNDFRSFMIGKKRTFRELFKAACIIDYQEGVNSLGEQKWLFSKLREIEINNDHVEWIAEAAITSAMSSSLWAPFDDCYALRGLLRCDEKKKDDKGKDISERVNETNFVMLTLRWLVEVESKGFNYFSEISIKLGKLEHTLRVICGDFDEKGKKRTGNGDIKCSLTRFGFKPLKPSFRLKTTEDLPLVLEYDKEGSNKGKILCLRFLTGFTNSVLHKFKDDFDRDQKKCIESDSSFGCWAGIDMFGMENFVYGAKFKKWLNLACDKLTEISKNSNQNKYSRNLWLRPHVGEGAWAMSSYPRRKECFKSTLNRLGSDYFDKGIFWLLQGEGGVSKLYAQDVYEILEFVYRSFFTEWFPIFSLSYGKRHFTLQGLGDAMPNIPNRATFSEDGERIGASNLGQIIDWIMERDVKKVNKYHPNIRFGHATHLNDDVLRKINILKDLELRKKEKVWVDLNFGSNVVTAANAINSLLKGDANDLKSTYGINIENEIKMILTAPFTSGDEQTCLVARSKQIGDYVEKLSKAGIKFVLGTDGQGAEATSIWTEIKHFNMACSLKGASGEELSKEREENMETYIKYGTKNLDLNFEFIISNN